MGGGLFDLLKKKYALQFYIWEGIIWADYKNTKTFYMKYESHLSKTDCWNLISQGVQYVLIGSIIQKCNEIWMKLKRLIWLSTYCWRNVLCLFFNLFWWNKGTCKYDIFFPIFAPLPTPLHSATSVRKAMLMQFFYTNS